MPRTSSVVLIFAFVHLCVSQFPGDHCLIQRRYRGVCNHLGRCPAAIRAIRRNVRPQTCGFDGNHPIVCCPVGGRIMTPPAEEVPTSLPIVTATSAPGAKSTQKCEEYNGDQSINSFIGTTVIGGVKSLTKEFPHMAALGFGSEDNVQWQCGGSLISELYVLTAAHCLYSQELGDVNFVRLGDLNLHSNTDDAEPQDFSVTNRIPHPEYRPPSQYHDIALLRLNQQAQFTNYVRPICLHTTHDLPPYRPIATGWGRIQYGGDSSDHLIKVILDYFSNDECKETYATISNRRLPNGIDDELLICAGGKNVEKDTCQGDSGGPLQAFDGKFRLVGITSFGKACGIANVPGVYTRVSHYVPWIERIVWPN